ncbi:prolyl oligopeptidase family serine peptidase [Candidatus Manganitrophus noduliformans]|nr:prolyl oligopeptidase family serine peptidase [Candidatus Manganitrophus noduliformans]
MREALSTLTDAPEGVMHGLISPEGEYVTYFQDNQGNEIGRLVRVPFHGGAPEDLTPNLPPYSTFDYAFSPSGNVFGILLAKEGLFHLYCINLGPGGAIGAPRLIHHSAQALLGLSLSFGGEIVVAGSTEQREQLHISLTAYDTTSGNRIATLQDGAKDTLRGVAFSPISGDFRLLASTTRSGVERPLLWNPRTKERRDLEFNEIDGALLPVAWSADGRRLLLMQMNRAVQQLYLYDITDNRLTRLTHPSGTFGPLGGGTCFGINGDLFFRWQDATHPAEVIILDGKTGARKKSALNAGPAIPARPWRSITFQSSDGEPIQGWLALPEGDGPFPTILSIHGGPEMALTECFSVWSQAWLDHRFAFLTINYRGSTTFGRAFQEKIWGNPGYWEVEDLAAAHTWLVREGIANPNQIFLTGWSYGGYLTLLALGKYPALWAGGMAGTAIADWALAYEDSADTIKAYTDAFFGGSPVQRPEQYAASSPMTYAEQVKAPLLIFQGKSDTRTPARQIEFYEKKMRSLGKTIEVHWVDAGHFGIAAQVKQLILYQERMLQFAFEVLEVGGNQSGSLAKH